MAEKGYLLQDEYLESSKEVIKNLALRSDNLIKFIDRADLLGFCVIAGSFFVNPLVFLTCGSLSIIGILKLKTELKKTTFELNKAGYEKYNFMILQEKKRELDICFDKIMESSCESEKLDMALQKNLERKFRVDEQMEFLSLENRQRIKNMIFR